MFNFKNLKFGTKILLLGISSVVVTVVALIVVIVWQSTSFTAQAQNEVDQLIDTDLTHIAEGVYNMVTAQDEAVQQHVNSSLDVAQLVMHNAGQVRLAEEKIEWSASNQFTQQSINVQLPKMYVGDTWLGQYTGRYDTTPIVDHVQMLVGGTATIFQRMNEQGDMLRVATNVLLPNGSRAIGTFIPAVDPDGSPDPVVSAVLRGSIFRGSAFVVDAWYDAAYAPIRDESGQVIGMVFVGVKQESVESIRQAIMRIQIEQSGYVYVLGSDGDERGHYIISQKGQRDGENIWDQQDAEGRYVIQSIVNKALTLKTGELATERYQWQNPGEAAPRWKIVRIAYYAPWHWVIGVSAYEDELAAYQLVLRQGQSSMIIISGAAGLLVALLASLASVLLARSISQPIGHLADAATQIAAGNLDVTAQVTQQDEIGTLATSFNAMTAQLRELIGTLEQRVTERTAQLQASAEVGRAAAAILDQDQLLREVVTLITERFGFYYAAVFLLDDTGKSAVLHEATGQAGQVLKERGHSLEVGGQSMVGYVTKQRKPRIALDVGKEAVRFANPLLPDTRSEIALPLVVGDRVLGALDVQSTQAAAFDESSAAVLQSMANQIAIALNNARQFRQTEHQITVQANLTQLGRSLLAATNAEELYRALANTLGGIVPHDYLSLTLAPGTSDVFREYRLHANIEPVLTEGSIQSTTNTLSGQAITTRLPAVSTDFAQDVPAMEDLVQLARSGFCSAMSLPLIVGDRVLGTLNFASRSLGAFSTKDTALLEQIASQVAAALENQRLVQAQQRSLRELEVLTRQLTGQAWATKLKQLSNQVQYVQYAHSGVNPNMPAQLPEIGMAMKMQQPIAYSGTDNQSLSSPYKATLAAPIMLRGEVLGALQVGEASQLRTWSDDDITFIQAVADQVALALDNARLIEQTERRAQREQLISEISRKMLAANDMRGVIQAAGDELGRALHVSRTEVKIGTESAEPAIDTTTVQAG
jgi:GAF domain-containing protein/signal transduction histidine kinase